MSRTLVDFFRQRIAALNGPSRDGRKSVQNRACVLTLLVGTAVAAADAAAAATLTTMPTGQGTTIILRGDITREDAGALDALLSASGDHKINAFRLDSPGGNLIGSIHLARIVQRHPELTTMVVNGSTCASACFLVFAAGHKRFADYRSFIGIHSVGDKRGYVTEETKAATVAMARFSAELGVPAEITDLMMVTPPDKIAWLSATDLRSMGTVMIGRPIQALRGDPRRDVPHQGPLPRLYPKLAGARDLPKMQAELVQRASDAASKADYATAIKIWRQLADAGHAAAQYNLGQMYYAGQGVRQDFGEAFRWYQRAAERGVSRAQLSLGLAYALGHGIPRDLTQADKWLHIALARDEIGSERLQALKARALVEARMTASEVADASQQASDWTSTH